MSDRHYDLKTRRYAVAYCGHDIEIEFDKKMVVINRVVLRVDGEQLDSQRVFYGNKELRATLSDGTEIEVAIESGMGGELTRAQLKQPDGSWVDLTERAEGGPR